jgi:small subunit ribosomal protein S20
LEIAVAHSLSAKKRVRQNANRNRINRARKSQIKTQIKRFEQALSVGDAKAASEQYQLVARKLDEVASTSTMHKNTAARKKSRLAKKLNSLKAKKA